MKILYVVAVNTSKSGSLMNHINGFIKSSKSYHVDFRIWYPKVEKSNINNSENKTLAIGLLKNYIINALLFDILCSLRLIFTREKFTKIVVRPSPITILIFITAKIKQINIQKECNGIYEYELKILKRGYLSKFSKLIDLLSNLFVDGIICVSEGIKEYQEKINPFKKNIRVIPNGVEKDLIFPYKKRSTSSKIRILFLGTFAPWQGIVEFLRLINKTEYFKDNFEFHIIGDGSLSKSKEFHSLVRKTKTVNHGWRTPDEIKIISESCDLGIIPRVTVQNIVGSPLKLFEYCALGLGILSTAIDGVRNIPHLSKNIYFFQYDEIKFKHLLKQIVDDKEDIERRAKQLNQDVKQFYTWDNVFKNQFL